MTNRNKIDLGSEIESNRHESVDESIEDFSRCFCSRGWRPVDLFRVFYLRNGGGEQHSLRLPLYRHLAGNPGDYNAACGIGNLVYGHYPVGSLTEQLNNSAFGIQNNVQNSNYSTGLGYSNTVNGVNSSTAVGASNSITNNFSTAIGSSNQTYGVANTTVGSGNVVGSSGAPTASAFSSAFGNENRVIGAANSSQTGFDASLAVGEANKVYGNQNVAIGNRSSIGSENHFYTKSFAGGMQATVYGNSSVAIGANAAAGLGAGLPANNAVALGASATVESNNSIALGAASLAQNIHTGAYSINGGSPAGQPSAANGVLSIGDANAERQIQNVAAGVIGATSTDAVNGSQLYAVGTQVNTNTANIATNASDIATNTANVNTLGNTTASNFGGGSTYTAAGGVSAPNYVVQNVAYHNVGDAIAAVQGGISPQNIYFSAQGNGALDGALAAGIYSTASGGGSTASGDQSTAIGAGSSATGTGSSAFGYNSTASASNSLALGQNSLAQDGNSVALGAGSRTSGVHTGVYSLNGGLVAGAPSNANGTVSVGAAGAERQLQNVAAGTLSATSTDAVNGSQLYSVGNQVNNVQGQVNGVQNQVSALGGAVIGVQNELYGVRGRAYEGTAVALAAAPAMLSPGKKFAIATNWGGFRGQNALGASALVRVHENVVLNAGIGVGLQHSGVGGRAGAMFEW